MTRYFTKSNIDNTVKDIKRILTENDVELVDECYYSIDPDVTYGEYKRRDALTGIAVTSEEYCHPFKPDDVMPFVNICLALGSRRRSTSDPKRIYQVYETCVDWRLLERAKQSLEPHYLFDYDGSNYRVYAEK